MAMIITMVMITSSRMLCASAVSLHSKKKTPWRPLAAVTETTSKKKKKKWCRWRPGKMGAQGALPFRRRLSRAHPLTPETCCSCSKPWTPPTELLALWVLRLQQQQRRRATLSAHWHGGEELEQTFQLKP
jgi:hypothetical protein